MTSVNFSLAANNAANTLNKNQRFIDTAMTRLATGKRINSGADAIGSHATHSSLLLGAVQNKAGVAALNMGVAYLNTVDAAITSIQKIFLRMKGLAVQASNTSMATEDRYGLDAEFQMLGNSWNRIVETTTFNEVSILTGANSLKINLGVGTAGVTEILIDDYTLDATATAGLRVASGATAVGTSGSGTVGGAVLGNFTGVEVTATGIIPATGNESILNAAHAALSSAKITLWMENYSGSKARIGGFTNGLTAMQESVGDQAVALEAGAAKIGNTDYAAETAALSAHQIISQAATAILAQANAQSSTVLSLLK